jgi:crotonobetainyl-CoA:carnitine CoA-transferase CaiB-like acyl-CoA transferase
MKTILLINGPWNGREIEDLGASVIRMVLYDGGEVAGSTVGESIYEPDESRDMAFWLNNNWLGTLGGSIPA